MAFLNGDLNEDIYIEILPELKKKQVAENPFFIKLAAEYGYNSNRN